MHIRHFFFSLGYALRGVWYVYRNEQNFRFQILAAIIVGILAWYFPLNDAERILVLLLIMLILILELVNSAIEKFTDIVKPRLHQHVQIVKDIMAGTVLVASVGSIILGLMIFVPHIIELFGL
ncbi:MAG: Diacylglycerol kinase [Candidatus Magasanikbacteria bacterium GW2011_GWD2_43_18]|uniref:Diacylglycerol kinase n=1 Tax=Candidatus Magasanikbacteria bacterium GW2011_GWE2_42_7 TaxID=1619052 RepID=A0A0G1BF47_9BACT|nr:MAG: Diacylglycerol kinase [Candidatus Magasanikbacteria bacterium GW2011_GWC2_42_27]KKS72005.1 MAG: Diacylglycerol kinase [Candidatus Magasanikbacteria bacterium GW2011_GWE2_42_7]KKT04844.1 MAG: Diacylglycerol kinase [Candidatus Magasanikbacteria bacterium GW2011_GWD2_43_18]KKT25214.1 MAG: Diacylglycerol kinase [Candidatus Magasanikbacteria bacterium GW2011_GWA2_43_9]HBB37540.1 UDP kinase [Candidatus Magasanikbacteria bacterium]